MMNDYSHKAFQSRTRQLWNTADELQWLNGLGKWSDATRNEQPESLLMNAIRGYSKREEWGKIDRKAVISRAGEMLYELSLRKKQ